MSIDNIEKRYVPYRYTAKGGNRAGKAICDSRLSRLRWRIIRGNAMRIGRLFLQLTLFYLVVTGLVLGLTAAFPGFEHFLPIGGAEGLLSGSADDPFETIEIGATRVGNLGESIVWLVIAVMGALMHGACRSTLDLHGLPRPQEFRSVAGRDDGGAADHRHQHRDPGPQFARARLLARRDRRRGALPQFAEELGRRAVRAAGDRHRSRRRGRRARRSRS